MRGLPARGEYAGSLIHSPNVYDFPASLHLARVLGGDALWVHNRQPVNFDELWMDERANMLRLPGIIATSPERQVLDTLCSLAKIGTRCGMPSDGPRNGDVQRRRPLLAVNKPAGLLTLGGAEGVPTLERQVRAWLKQRYDKPGNVYLGIPHRLDRPVSGVVVFSRNSKGAARLAEQFRERRCARCIGAVEGITGPAEADIVDWLIKAPDQARVEIVLPARGGRECG